MDQKEPKWIEQTEWADVTEVDSIGLKCTERTEQNQCGLNMTEQDQNRPNQTIVNQLDQIGLNQTEYDQSEKNRPNRTKVD